MSQVGSEGNYRPPNNGVPLPLPVSQKIIANRYELLELVGRGDVSRVYRSLDRVLNREVAVKLLREENIDDQDAVVRFNREARFLASLTSPYILKIYDFGHFETTYFIVMEYVEGINLKELEQRTGKFSVERALIITDQVLQALTAAHNNQIIHRDIKPQNILLQPSTQIVRLTDFGVARNPNNSTITRPENGVGSIEYMAPEQSTGGVIGPAADIYSTGVVLFEMLAGRLPFEGNNQMQIALQHLYNQPPSFKSLGVKVPAELERVVQRALEKDPTRRYQTPGDMRAALAAVPATLVSAISTPSHHAGSQPSEIYHGEIGSKAGQILLKTKPVSLSATTRRPRLGFLLPLLLIPLLLLMVGLVFLFNSGLLSEGDSTPERTAVAAIFATPVSASPTLATVPATATVNFPSSTPSAGTTPETIKAVITTASSNNEVATVPAPTLEPTETASPAPTPSPAPTLTPEPTATLEPTLTPEPTATLEPTATPKPEPTATLKPVATAAPRPTQAPTVPEATSTPPKPAPTITQNSGSSGSLSGKLNPYLLQGSYKRLDGTLYGRPEIALYGSGSGYNQGQIKFNINALPSGNSAILLTGLDDERVEHCNLEIVLNGTPIFDAGNLFPNVPNTDAGEGGVDRYWGQQKIFIPPDILHPGENSLVLRNITPWAGHLGIPYILINSVEIVAS